MPSKLMELNNLEKEPYEEEILVNKIEKIYEKVEAIESMMQVMLRSKSSDKIQRLREEAMFRKKMNVNQVQGLFGISRPWTLNLMRTLAKDSHFTFIVGKRSQKIPSQIIYEEAKITRERHEILKEVLEKEEVVSFYDLTKHLGLNVEMDLPTVMSLAKNFVEVESEYFIKDGNKISRKIIQ